MMPSWDVIDRNTTSSMLGFKDHYAMNKWLLMGEGDILLLHTDGMSEHVRGAERYFPGTARGGCARRQARSARDVLRSGYGRPAGLQPAGRRHQPGGHQAHMTRSRVAGVIFSV
jgi:hypothetical protein